MNVTASPSVQFLQSESLFPAVIPPLLKADVNGHNTKAFYCAPPVCSFDCCASLPLRKNPFQRKFLNTARFPSPPSQSRYPSSVISLDSSSLMPESPMVFPSRQLEVSLIRRELSLQQEIQNYRIEETENEKRHQLQEQRKEELEVRERLLASFRQIEEERAKRLEEQQDRLLQKERDFEDYKAQKAKEVEAARERRIAVEEKRRELLFQQELEKIKVESESRSAAKQACEKVQLEYLRKHLSQFQEEVQEQFQKELQMHEQQCRESLLQQAGEWEKQLVTLDIERQNFMANLQLQREKDADKVSSSERQVIEAKDEIARVKKAMAGMQKALLSRSGENEIDAESSGNGFLRSSMAMEHRRSIQQLQEIFEEDKRRSRRQFTEEVERLKTEMERRMDELRDQHRVQMRYKEEELLSTQRQLGEAQRCLEEERAKLAMRLHTGDEYFVQEEARLKEEVRTFRIKHQELEESHCKDQRRIHDQEMHIDQQAKTIQALQCEIHRRWQKRNEEMNTLREENRQLRQALQFEKSDREDEANSLRSQLQAAKEQKVILKAKEELENMLQSVTAAKESQEKLWEKEKEQLRKKIRKSEEDLQSAKQREAALEGKVAAMKQREIQTERERSAEWVNIRKEKEESKKSLESLKLQLRETLARLQRAEEDLRAEREQQEQWRTTTAASKNQEILRLAGELEKRKREISNLQDAKANLKISQETERHRFSRLLREKEGELSMRQGEVAELHHLVAQQQRSVEDLQRRLDSTIATYQQKLQEREETMNSLQTRVTEITEEQIRGEGKLGRMEEQRLLASQDASAQQQLLDQKDFRIARIEDETQAWKRETNAQKSTIEELRARLEHANETIHTLSLISSHSNAAMPRKTMSNVDGSSSTPKEGGASVLAQSAGTPPTPPPFHPSSSYIPSANSIDGQSPCPYTSYYSPAAQAASHTVPPVSISSVSSPFQPHALGTLTSVGGITSSAGLSSPHDETTAIQHQSPIPPSWAPPHSLLPPTTSSCAAAPSTSQIPSSHSSNLSGRPHLPHSPGNAAPLLNGEPEKVHHSPQLSPAYSPCDPQVPPSLFPASVSIPPSSAQATGVKATNTLSSMQESEGGGPPGVPSSLLTPPPASFPLPTATSLSPSVQVPSPFPSSAATSILNREAATAITLTVPAPVLPPFSSPGFPQKNDQPVHSLNPIPPQYRSTASMAGNGVLPVSVPIEGVAALSPPSISLSNNTTVVPSSSLFSSEVEGLSVIPSPPSVVISSAPSPVSLMQPPPVQALGNPTNIEKKKRHRHYH